MSTLVLKPPNLSIPKSTDSNVTSPLKSSFRDPAKQLVSKAARRFTFGTSAPTERPIQQTIPPAISINSCVDLVNQIIYELACLKGIISGIDSISYQITEMKDSILGRQNEIEAFKDIKIISSGTAIPKTPFVSTSFPEDDILSPVGQHPFQRPDEDTLTLTQWIYDLQKNLWILSDKCQRYEKTMTSILNQNSRKKKLAELVNSVHKSWVNLMLNLNLVIQQEQKSNQANTSDNLTKLAVATGLTDWLDLNVNDAKAVYMQGEKYLLGYGVPQSFETAYKRYESAAKSNLPEALNMMGVMCEFGLGRQTDIALGHKYYTMAAKLDCPEALNHLGRLNESGKGCEVSYKNAVASYKRASQLGFDDATTNYGYMVEHGLGCPEDKRLAFELYKSAADKGFARAQNALGNCFYKGIGVSKDYFQASILYRKASEQGYTPAHNNLGICYEEGQGVPKDLGQAKVCYKQAAEKHHPNATNNLGYMLLLEKNYIEAIQQFYLAKTLGNVDATFQLGYLYELGCSDNSGVILGPDLHMALRFYQECAVKGHIKAILRMASLLICGPESIMDIPTAVSILNIAANPPNSRKPSTKDDPENRVIQASLHGDPDAQNMLGELCELGLHDGPDGSPDISKAVSYYRSAMKQGHARAIFNLGALYENGTGVSQDMQKALTLYKEASKRGSEESQLRIQELIDLDIISLEFTN